MKKILIVIFAVMLFAGCGESEKLKKLQAQNDSLKAMHADVKLDSLSGKDFAVYYSNEKKAVYAEGKFWGTKFGISLDSAFANKIRAEKYVNVDGLDSNRIRQTVLFIDSLRRVK